MEELFIRRSSSLNKLEGSWWLRVWLRGRVWLLDSDWWKGRLIIIELLKERLKMSLECTVEVVQYRLSHVCNDISYAGWKTSSNRLALLL